MNILFCSEGFIIDGVASYNLYLSACLAQAGHNVSIIGRWMGPKGFQQRHRKAGVRVIQFPSINAHSLWLTRRAKEAKPDVIITDARRAFPLSQRIRDTTGAKVVTVFHDPPQPDRKGARGIEAIMRGSDAWVTSEKPIFEKLKQIKSTIPKHFIQRPIEGLVQPTPLPPRKPFKCLCLGRLSRWKSPGLKVLVERAAELREKIPSLEIRFVGGGGRIVQFWRDALKANIRAGKRFVHIAGAKTDPQPWIQEATLVCAGATSAIEAILGNRPVIAFSGFWLGLVTRENLEAGISTHFGERSGEMYVKDNPNIVFDSLVETYEKWCGKKMALQVQALRDQLAPHFSSKTVSEQFIGLIQDI
jgi:glycosyltransferase involved in cell wall biosynthesis